MSKQARIAHLSWLRAPVQKSVDIAKLSLDIYHKKAVDLASPPTDAEAIWFVNQTQQRDEQFDKLKHEVDLIHSAMVVGGCEGGRSLALEVKILLNNIREKILPVDRTEKALVALIGALFTIPKYLLMVIEGAPDNVGILAKQINELREIRGVPLIEEENLLPPDLEFAFIDPPNKNRECSPDLKDEVFGRASKRFQAAFSSYMQSQNKNALVEMQAVLLDLEKVTQDAEVGCFWWMGQGLMSALHAGAIRSNGNIMTQIRMLSVAIQKVDSEDEEGARNTLGVQRFKSLMSVMSMSTRLPLAVEQMLAVFNVKKSVDSDSLEALQTRIETSQAASIRDVVPELKPLLESSMICLGRAITCKTIQTFNAQMSSFRSSIRQVASVFYMVNENELAAVAANALTTVEPVIGSDYFTEQIVESLKSDFMFLDERIDRLDSNDAIRSLKISRVKPDVVAKVVSEALKELANTRKLITNHLDSGTGSDDLQQGLGGLLKAANALEFTGIIFASQVLNGSCQTFMNLLEQGSISPSQGVNLAARSLVAVEVYLQSIVQGHEPSPTLLERASADLAKLGILIQHVESVSSSSIIAMFEAARSEAVAETEEEENHFLSELFELRSDLERMSRIEDIRKREAMEHLYITAERLAMAAKLNGFENFSRFVRALATYSQTVQAQSKEEGFDVTDASCTVKAGVEMCLRCIDEYSARAKISIFTIDLERTLLSKSDPAIVQSIAGVDEILSKEIIQDEPAVEVLEGELVDSSSGPSLDERQYPDDEDGVLIDMFKEEFQSYHAVLKRFCESGAWDVSRDVCRAAHSIHGISGSANCEVLHKVYGALEARLEALITSEMPLTQTGAADLEVLLEETAAYVADFPWARESLSVSAWVGLANQIGNDDIEDAVFVELPAPVHAAINPVSGQNESENILHAEISEPSAFSELDGEGTNSSAILLRMDPNEAAPTVEYTDAEFYLEDADDVLPDLQANVERWLENMTDQDLVSTIKRNMHTLKGAAAMAGAKSIADITHSMETLFESLAYGIVSPSPDCAKLVSYVLDVIRMMTSLVRRGMAYERPTTLIACLESAVESNSIDLSSLYIQEPAVISDIDQLNSALLADVPLHVDHTPLEGDDHTVAKPVVNTSYHSTEALSAAKVDEGTDVPVEAGLLVARRRRRGGRGKGGAHNNTKAPSDLTLVESATTHSLLEGIAPSSGSVSTDEYHDSTVTQKAVEVTGASVPQEQPPIETEAAEKEIPHAETIPAQLTSSELQPPEAIHNKEKRTRHPEFTRTPEARTAKPIVSRAIADMISREEQAGTAGIRGKSNGNTEKMKVDLRLLEDASEQSSELTAGCYRLDAMNEDVSLRLAAVYEQLQANMLQHGQFTTVLRGFLNNQPLAKTTQGVDDLERFNDISAIHVAMGASTDEILEELTDVMGVNRQMRGAFKDQGQLISSLQRDLLDSRLVPFQNIVPKLTLSLKQVLTATGKTVITTFEGAGVIMDKMILDGMAEPLTHILRNAIDHGIESKTERLATGKKADGSLRITVFRRGKNVVISITDDGRGIDATAIRKKAIEKNIISADDRLTEKEVLRLVTKNGFSTAAQVTQVSGRGVGMDIVAAAVENLGGQLVIDTLVGQGTTFSIELPFTIGTNRAALVSSGTQWFAIQSYAMTQIMMVDREKLESQRAPSGHVSIDYLGNDYEIVHLADLIAMPESRRVKEETKNTKLVLCSQGEARFAIEVAEIDSMPEIHVRKIEGILSHVRGIIGETEMQDGSPVFVLDVMELARLNLKKDEFGHYQVRQNRVRSLKRDKKPLAFVIDDSRSYRNHLERVFTALGYKVALAVNGQDALHKLEEIDTPEFIIVDVEMPEMNGLEFTERVRAMPQHDELPIMMMTTKYQYEEKAMSIGVDVFLKKPLDPPVLQKAIATVKGLRMRKETLA